MDAYWLAWLGTTIGGSLDGGSGSTVMSDSVYCVAMRSCFRALCHEKQASAANNNATGTAYRYTMKPDEPFSALVVGALLGSNDLLVFDASNVSNGVGCNVDSVVVVVGFVVGAGVGLGVGALVGSGVGESVGNCVGIIVGLGVGGSAMAFVVIIKLRILMDPR